MYEQPPKPKGSGDDPKVGSGDDPKVGSGDDPKMEPVDPGNLLEREVGELSKPLKVRHVTLMEPVESRNVNQVISAMNLVLTKMHFLGVVVNRIHSDRAKELLSHKFQSWVHQRNVLHTFTAGDDPQSNGHCEAEVCQLKRRTRLLLHVASQENTSWPQAMRYATEEARFL